MIGVSLFLAIIVLSILVWYWVRWNERQHELYAIYEVSREVSLRLERALKNITEFKATKLPLLKSEMSGQIDEQVKAHIQICQQRIPSLINGEFFMKAIKARLPWKAWKEEFNAKLNEMGNQLLDQKALQISFETSANQLLGQVGQFLEAELSSMEIHSAHFSEITRSVLNKHNQSQNYRALFSGPGGDFTELLDVSFGKGMIIGSGTILAGVVGMIDPHLIILLCAAALRDLIGRELGQQAMAIITEWIIQEIGEQALNEMIEAVGALATGIGAVFVAWKIFRYGRLMKRLLIDQEPLTKMQRAIEVNVVHSLRSSGESLLTSLNGQTEKCLAEVEQKLKSIYIKSAERRDWTFARLRHSLRARTI